MVKAKLHEALIDYYIEERDTENINPSLLQFEEHLFDDPEIISLFDADTVFMLKSTNASNFCLGSIFNSKRSFDFSYYFDSELQKKVIEIKTSLWLVADSLLNNSCYAK